MNKAKLRYSPSRTEFILLVVLLVVGIIALSFNYLLLPEWENLSGEMTRYENQKAALDSLKAEYSRLAEYEAKAEELLVKLQGLKSAVPSYLSEEEIISSVDEAAAKSGLNVLSMSFSGITEEKQEAFLTSITPKNETSKKGGDGSLSVLSERVAISFTGSYPQLFDFLSGFEKDMRQIYFRNLSVSRTNDGELNGSVNMLIFSALHPDDKTSGYPGYDYDSPSPSGKDDPFSPFGSYSGGRPGGVGATSNPDFYAILNTYDDNSSKIFLGKHPVSAAQISADNNDKVTAGLKLSLSGSTLSYTYSLGSRSYSGSFDVEAGKSSVVIDIYSRLRKSTADRVGMTLNVQNDTTLPLIVRVSNDDPSAPRFSLGTTSGSVRLE